MPPNGEDNDLIGAKRVVQMVAGPGHEDLADLLAIHNRMDHSVLGARRDQRLGFGNPTIPEDTVRGVEALLLAIRRSVAGQLARSDGARQELAELVEAGRAPSPFWAV